jgi:hypothetical protein
LLGDLLGRESHVACPPGTEKVERANCILSHAPRDKTNRVASA